MPKEMKSGVELCSVASTAQIGIEKMKEGHFFSLLLPILPLAPSISSL